MFGQTPQTPEVLRRYKFSHADEAVSLHHTNPFTGDTHYVCGLDYLTLDSGLREAARHEEDCRFGRAYRYAPANVEGATEWRGIVEAAYASMGLGVAVGA